MYRNFAALLIFEPYDKITKRRFSGANSTFFFLTNLIFFKNIVVGGMQLYQPFIPVK
jgi:hypothetical protein